MNKLFVPPSPNWYETKILACASDDTVIYGTKNDVVVIYKPKPEDECPPVSMLERVHVKKVVSADVNKQWGEPHKYALTASDDKLAIWDIGQEKKIYSRDLSLKLGDREIGATFLTETRVISVTQEGHIDLWLFLANQSTRLSILNGLKNPVTSFSACPHLSSRAAFGLKNGLIIVADLRRNGKILYKLRGHNKEVISLSWCPAPVNIFPSNPNHVVKFPNKTDEVKKAIEEGNSQADNATSDKFNGGDLHNKVSEDLSLEHVIDLDGIELAQEVVDGTEGVGMKKNVMDLAQNKNDSEPPKKEAEDADLNKIIDDKVEEIVDSIALKENAEDANSKKSTNESVPETIDSESLAKAKIMDKKISTPRKPNPWMNLTHADDDEQVSEPKVEEDDALLNKTEDFLQECKALHEKISHMWDGNVSKDSHESSKKKREEIRVPDALSEGVKVDDLEKKQETKCEERIPEISPVVESKESGFEEERDAKEDEKSKENEEVVGENKKEPVAENVLAVTAPTHLEEEARNEFLLASSAKDDMIYIWRAGSDGRLQTFFKLLELKPRSKYNNKLKNHVEHMWNVVHWVTPTKLLACSKGGQFLEYTLPKTKDSKWFVPVHDQNYGIFSIVSPFRLYTKCDWSVDHKPSVWTTSQDRYIINTSLDSTRSTNISFHTMSGHVTTMAQSPLDPCRLALGMSMGMIKIWNMSSPHSRHFSTMEFTQRMQGRITCLAWHPCFETDLAFCTEEGRIGLINAVNPTKPCKLFKHYFTQTVHKIEWGPLPFNKEEYGVYAASNGKMVLFSSEAGEDPFVIEAPANTSIYTFAWKPDYNYLLAIDVNGPIYVYSDKLQILRTIYSEKKMNHLRWHPDLDTKSTFGSYLAASYENVIRVYKFPDKLDDDVQLHDLEVANLKGHVNYINSVVWSPFAGNRLATAGEEGFIQIWDVLNRCLVASYHQKFYEPLTSVSWSTLNEDIVICGHRNGSLVAWKISEAKVISEKELTERRKHYLQTARIEKKYEAPKEESFLKSTGSNKTAKNKILPLFGANKMATLANLKKILEWVESPTKVDGGGDGAKSVENGDMSEIFDLFSNQASMLKLLNGSAKECKKNGSTNTGFAISMWKGDFGEYIKHMIAIKKVTPLIISIAPMVSMGLWQQACETYVGQLQDSLDSDPLEMAMYYLAIHKVEAAIKVLCHRDMFKEALALARCRLPEENVFVNKIIADWAQSAKVHGSLEVSALCYIVLKNYEEASKVLFRRSSADILEFALKLAKKTDNQPLVQAIEYRWNAFKKKEDLDLKTRLEVELSLAPRSLSDDVNDEKIDSNMDSPEIERGVGPTMTSAEIEEFCDFLLNSKHGCLEEQRHEQVEDSLDNKKLDKPNKDENVSEESILNNIAQGVPEQNGENREEFKEGISESTSGEKETEAVDRSE